MKKLSLFFAFCIFAATFVVCAILLESCEKKNCQGLVHANPPVLSDTGYNTCEAIYYNYNMYMGHGEGQEMIEQMYLSEIKAYGYIHTYVYPERNYYTLADIPQQSEERPEIELQIDHLWVLDPIEIDDTKKYYVTGIMGFTYHGHNESCMTFIPKILRIDSCYHE